MIFRSRELSIIWLFGFRLLLLCGNGRLRGGTNELMALLGVCFDRRVRRGEPGYWNLVVVGLLFTAGASILGISPVSIESEMGRSKLVLQLSNRDRPPASNKLSLSREARGRTPDDVSFADSKATVMGRGATCAVVSVGSDLVKPVPACGAANGCATVEMLVEANVGSKVTLRGSKAVGCGGATAAFEGCL